MKTYLIENRHGYGVKFSRFSPDRIFVASSQFFGLAGGGTLHVLDFSDNFKEVNRYQWSDGIFDVISSEKDPNIVISAAGDGTMQLWNLESFDKNSPLMNLPQMIYKEHRKEIYHIDWLSVRSNNFMLSASWDTSIKLWDPNFTASIATFNGHSKIVYSASFSPLIPNIFSSTSADSYLKIWSIAGENKPIASLKSSDCEVLTCDFCKFDQNILATGSSDGIIRGYDLRHFKVPMFELMSTSDYAVRKIQFSPFEVSQIASVGYDSYTRIWDFNRTTEPLESMKHHTDVAYGLDWNKLRRNELADCGWDQHVHVFSPTIIED